MRASGSVASSIVQQRLSSAKVIELSHDQLKNSAVRRFTNSETGSESLEVTFSRPNGNNHVIDLSYLLQCPNLWEPLALGFRLWGLSVIDKTRNVAKHDIRSGLIVFLLESNLTQIHLREMDDLFFTGYIQWLNFKITNRHDGQALATQTRNAKLKHLRRIISALSGDAKWGEIARRAFSDIPKNPWSGRSRRTIPTERLHSNVFAAVLKASENAILTLMRETEKREALLAEGEDLLSRGVEDYSRLSICLAQVRRVSAISLPMQKRLRAIHPDLERGIRDNFGFGEISRMLYPNAEQIVPFVLFIAICTAFNSGTVLSMDWSGIERSSRFGLDTIRLSGPKARAHVDPSILLDASSSSSEVLDASQALDALKRLTQHLRSSIKTIEHSDRIFIFKPACRSTADHAKAFWHAASPSADVTWKYALRSFCDENEIPQFNLKQIRPTVLDEVQLKTSDIVLAQRLARHRNPTTTWQHYTSSGTRARYRERLGEIYMLRERWIGSGGKIDPRSRVLGASDDRGAATPGFWCMDPLDSPRPAQRKNRLCSAYGECPSCPLAAARVDDPSSVAMYLGLAAAIENSKPRMDPQSWILRWDSVLSDLRGLLRLVQERVLEEATAFKVQLPLVG